MPGGGGTTIYINDINGKEIFSKILIGTEEISGKMILPEKLNPGVYFIQYIYDGIIEKDKLVIEASGL